MASSLTLPKPIFLSPQTTPRHRLCRSKVSLTRDRRGCVGIRTRIRAVNEEGVVVEERERQLIKELSGNGAASAVTSDSSYSVSAERYSNGVAGLSDRENGSLVKYVNGNGVAAAELVEEVEDPVAKEDGRKRRIEEIGKEDAWFKRTGKDSVEVNWC